MPNNEEWVAMPKISVDMLAKRAPLSSRRHMLHLASAGAAVAAALSFDDPFRRYYISLKTYVAYCSGQYSLIHCEMPCPLHSLSPEGSWVAVTYPARTVQATAKQFAAHLSRTC